MDNTTTKPGILYGVGVGPGDPDLLTMKAVKVLKTVPVIFAAGSTKNDYSLALNVVRDHLMEDVAIVSLPFPMTQARDTLTKAWSDNARQVLESLRTGRDAAFITIGDPLTYSTFGYLCKTIQVITPDIRIETIPGITAHQAAAARLNLPLVEGTESLTVIPGTWEPEKIREAVNLSDNCVILKVYRHYDRISTILAELDLDRHSVLVSRCGHEDEYIQEGVRPGDGAAPPYLSLLIVKKQ